MVGIVVLTLLFIAFWFFLIKKGLLKKSNKKHIARIIAVLISVLYFILILLLAISGKGYQAEESAFESIKSDDSVSVNRIDSGYYFDGPGTDSAFIFYPGAKVQPEAYAPMLNKLAKEGVDCFLVVVPHDMAMFGINKANNIIDGYNYKKWYVGGHSLGGAMAGIYASNNNDKISGIVFLAAFSVKKIDEKDKVLSIIGENDGVINKEKYDSNKSNWSKDATELIIKGGNHAGYGFYGEQKGDNKASISKEEQQQQTVDAILQFMK
ncbi:MAG: alpha/beta hydrolase [Lachnospiraceae bacterium]|nr:alpha/beta hydrolase [Lachnospiraceae bacterium]